MALKIGDTVRVKGYRKHAKIELFYDDIIDGIRLDREIGGFFSWNLADLVKVKK